MLELTLKPLTNASSKLIVIPFPVTLYETVAEIKFVFKKQKPKQLHVGWIYKYLQLQCLILKDLSFRNVKCTSGDSEIFLAEQCPLMIIVVKSGGTVVQLKNRLLINHSGPVSHFYFLFTVFKITIIPNKKQEKTLNTCCVYSGVVTVKAQTNRGNV